MKRLGAVLAALLGAHAASAQCCPDARLSHSGLYVNLPQASTLVLYLNSTELAFDNARVSFAGYANRTAQEIRACAESTSMYTAIEACEFVDTQRDAEPMYEYRVSSSARLVEHGIPITQFAPLANAPLGWMLAESEETVLRSVRITLKTHTRKGAPYECHWWLAHLFVPSHARARWPIAPSDAYTRDNRAVLGMVQNEWDGKEPVRISGLMQDPFLPHSRKEAFSQESAWSTSLTMRLRTDGSPVQIRAPVRGTIVWSRAYTRRRLPFHGGWNDEQDWCIVVRDALGFMVTLFGFDVQAPHAQEGDMVDVGDVLGTAPTGSLSHTPPNTQPPADPPKDAAHEGFLPYPYRYRGLQLRVSRTARESACVQAVEPGNACFHPDAQHAIYYNPQLFLSLGTYRSSIPPFSEPARILFSPFVSAVLTEEPVAVPVHSVSYITQLHGPVELFAAFQSFQETPGHASDAMDPISLYALDWAVVPVDAGSPCDAPETTYWRRAFEHSKLPNAWSHPIGALNGTETLLSHYVPALALRTKLSPLFRSHMATQYDEKGRSALYAVTRTRLGEPSRGGVWNTTQEEPGMYYVAVRAYDTWGNAECIASYVRIASQAPLHTCSPTSA
ncbi:hypothetical protein MVES1_003057 [Malassezia vespertilionis]|uniref:uncharacterized protein n=1 Tax=Malassezia vespertilionis TaxID=2020962 RepID=UPI0024B159D8|nr:uncharacterized protein MVES1_003057 [Malassezia vespertilionis]WFD07688.1 hypothetical protein MVES1_003057 [Malassezia vespertilionis]